MHDASLDLRGRIKRFDRLGKPRKAINDRDQDVAQTTKIRADESRRERGSNARAALKDDLFMPFMSLT